MIRNITDGEEHAARHTLAPKTATQCHASLPHSSHTTAVPDFMVTWVTLLCTQEEEIHDAAEQQHPWRLSTPYTDYDNS